MKLSNWVAVLVLSLSCLGLAACSEKMEPSEKEAVAENDTDTVVEPVEERGEIPVAAQTLEEMIVQQPGKLIEAHMEPEVEAALMKNYFTYRNFVDKTFLDIARNEVQLYFEEHQNLTSSQIYDYLVYQLGSGQYEGYYEKLYNYDHGYVMPELPDGEDEIKLAKARQTNVVILMDASGSMRGEVKGGAKMKLAKEAIEKFTSELSDDVHVALFAYGHKGEGVKADKELSCGAIEVFYPLNTYDKSSFHQAMDSFQESGWTPLAGAIEQANEYLFPYGGEGYKNIVYIVSDGIETCDGNPVEAAKKLNASNIEAKVNIIGFDVDDEGQNQLKQVAEAGGGQYATVRDQSEFEGVLIKKWQPSLMQVINQQGVKLHELVHQMEELMDIYDPLSNLSDREGNRIVDMAYFLKDKKLISEEDARIVIDRAKEMKELRSSHFRALYDQKSEEAKTARDEIDEKVKAWRDKWYEELDKK